MSGFYRGHPDYVSPEARKRAAIKTGMKLRGRTFTDEQRKAFASYWENKKGKTSSRRTGKYVPCQSCGVSVYKYSRDLRRSKRMFCSIKCKGAFFNHGKTALHDRIRDSKEYIAWRRHVFQMDNYTCQACGQRGGKLIADHELSFSRYPDLRLEILNGRTLCEPCHHKTYNYGYKAIKEV